MIEERGQRASDWIDEYHKNLIEAYEQDKDAPEAVLKAKAYMQTKSTNPELLDGLNKLDARIEALMTTCRIMEQVQRSSYYSSTNTHIGAEH